MGTILAPIVILLVAILGVILVALPVKVAAGAMHARRTGFLWCLLAMAGSYVLHGIGLSVPVIGTVVAFFLSALAFAVILGTDYLRGVGIELLAIIFSAILVALLALLAVIFGVSLGGLLAILSGAHGAIFH